MKRIIDAGHYYASHGPTYLSVLGWEIACDLKTKEDSLLLFIDDVHAINDLHPRERAELVVEFQPNAEFLIKESEVFFEAREVLERLKALPKKKRAKRNGEGKWFCSGATLTNESETPLCNLLDAGLSLRKLRMGFHRGINILPYFYEDQQRHLLRIIEKSLPEFSLSVVLFDEKRNHWQLR